MNKIHLDKIIRNGSENSAGLRDGPDRMRVRNLCIRMARRTMEALRRSSTPN